MKKIFLISFSIISISLFIFIQLKKEKDIFKEENILVGSWSYNDLGGFYEFNSDYNYYQYISSSTLDNYCFGNYEYSYGGIDKDGNLIKQDNIYYYYTLILKPDYCIINGNKDTNIERSNIVFSVSKDNYNDIFFMDTIDNLVYRIKRIEEKED